MIASSRNYAIGMVHFQIAGGWLVTGIILGVYLLGFFGVMAMAYYADLRSGGAALTGLGKVLLGFLMALQGLVLLGFGGYRVSGAIRTDISSRMLESHRLMPISSARAVLGYLFGPPTPALAFVLLNLMLSLAFGNWLGGSLDRLILNQAVIVGFAVFAWSAIGLGTFIYRHMFIIGFAAMILALCTGLATGAYMLLPGISLLLTPFLGESVFNVTGPLGAASSVPYDLYAMGLSGQAALFFLFFLASCRLYRGTYATAFSAWQALGLLATWAVLSALGISHSGEFGLGQLFGAGRDFSQGAGVLQVCGSVAACLLVAMIPLWSVLKQEQARPSALLKHALTLLAVSAIATVPACGALWMDSFGARAMAITFTVVFLQMVVIYCLLRLVRNLMFILAALIIVGALFALNLTPLILEMLRLNFTNGGDNQVSVLVTFSPMGLVAAEWSRGITGNALDVSPVPGCLWQLLIAGLMLAITYFVVRRPIRPAPVTIPPRQSVPS